MLKEIIERHYDFRKARVRESRDNGKTWSVLDKFSLGSVLHHDIDFYKYLYWDVYKYEELKQFLLDELVEMGAKHILTN